MPPKIRELIAELERHGFKNRGGKEAIEITRIRFVQDLLQFQVKRETMHRNIKSDRSKKRLTR